MNSLVDYINTEVNELDTKKKLRTAAAAGLLGGSALLGLYSLPGQQKKGVKTPDVPSVIEPIKKPADVPKEHPSVPAEAPVQNKVVRIDMGKVASIESSGDPRAVNPNTKARGLCQFMRPTWEEVVRKMGKDWTWEDAFDPDKNLAAANYYMNKNIPAILRSFNIPDTIETRLAAYNWGAGNVRKAYRKYGDKWLEHAPMETKNYIKKYYKLSESIKEDRWGTATFINSKGEEFRISTSHSRFAKEMLGKNYKRARIRKYDPLYLYMAETGYVRLHKVPSGRGGNLWRSVGVTVVNKISYPQLAKINKYIKDTDLFGYELYRVEGRKEPISVEQGDDPKEFNQMIRRLGFLGESIRESIIDYPLPELSPSVWERDGSAYSLSEKAADKILDALYKYPDVKLVKIAKEIHITGSICTNQYVEDTDIDVHIIPKDIEGIDGELQKNVFLYYKNNPDYIGEHPIEVYIQTNPAQEYLSEGVYDLLSDRWLKGPKIVPLDLDPYEEYSDIADIVRAESQKADKLIGELKRDVIDYDVILKALSVLSGPEKLSLATKLKAKLKEVESDIQELMRKKKKWVDARKLASQPTTIAQALKDVELAKQWRDKNAIFKFLNRYRYIKFISELEAMMKSEAGISKNEVGLIQGMMGVGT